MIRQRNCFLLLVTMFLANMLGAFAQSPQGIELSKNWQLASMEKAGDSGAEISQVTYSSIGWYPIHSMPGTVLSILQEDGVYPNLYYGMNLLTEVPQDLWKKQWWYRTTFEVPQGATTYWLDFPGINYRAEIWLNGEKIASDKQVVGMYVHHRFNVTKSIRPGHLNALAVKVTPERLIQDVDGVELADSWQDWINWKYLGYHGPVDPLKMDKSGLVVRYVAPDGHNSPDGIKAKVTVTAATPTSESLEALVTSNDKPVAEGKVLFWHDEEFLGESPLDSNGKSTLETRRPFGGISFVPDRNAGIWKPVYLYTTGTVKLGDALVDTELPLPSTDTARLTIYANLSNGSVADVDGILEATITRRGKPSISIRKPLSVKSGETREVRFTNSEFPQLVVHHPDLWWPYTMGKPALYNLHLRFISAGKVSDTEDIRFGIRQVTKLRDGDTEPDGLGKGGNFYLQVNGRDFLVRGADYTPDLLYQYSPGREEMAIRYTKDMGLNMLRWESKISSKHMIDLADQEGIPVMLGWMCCNQWEKWDQWSTEDQKVAQESLRSQALMLRSHAAVFIWANGSDGLPPKAVRDNYHNILEDLHWQNTVVDSAASHGPNEPWDGIRMRGPYAWRAPSYWFTDGSVGAQGSCAEEGDNENIPPYESLLKFIPKEHLWPIDEYWYMHAGAIYANSLLLNTREALDRRYGPSSSVQAFAEKAQLGLYEETRAQFEGFAANGWQNHKMTLYWMLNSAWPTFYGHLFDYYGKPGGAYFGAKAGLRPVSVVFDYFANGDHRSASIRVVNQTLQDRDNLKVRVRIYDLHGTVRYDRSVSDVRVAAQDVNKAMNLPLLPELSSVYFVRCELFEQSGKRIVNNVYWQSSKPDDPGNRSDDRMFWLSEKSWADMTALNDMAMVPLQIAARVEKESNTKQILVSLHNPTNRIAFFERIEMTDGKDGAEVLPIMYSDNYVTVFPGETERVTIHYPGATWQSGKLWLRVTGHNTSAETAPIQ